MSEEEITSVAEPEVAPTKERAKKEKKSPASPSQEKVKKEKKAKVEKPTKTSGPAHPPVSEMVIAAVTALNEKGGSSSVNIKKYLTSEYKVDVEKLTTYIRKALRNAVETGVLLQTKGKNGSFKLPYHVKNKAEKKPKKEKEAKPKKSPAKKSGRGRPKKDAAPKAKAAKPKAEEPKGSAGGRGRPKKNPSDLKAKPTPSGKGRGRPKKSAE